MEVRKIDKIKSYAELRERAENLLNQKGGDPYETADIDFLRLFHELEVHQIELELQNEELRRAQKDLYASRDEYASLFNSAPNAYVIVGSNGLIERYNRVAGEMFGPGRLLIGGAFVRLIHPEDRSSYFSLLGNRLYGRQVSCELRIFGKESQIVDVLMQMAIGPDESVGLRRLLVFSDITMLKQADKELKQSYERLEAALDASGGAIYDHRVPLDESTFHDNRWTELMGYGHAELPSYEHFLDWLYKQVHPEDLDLLERAYSDFIEGRVPGYHVEIRLRHKQGHWIWVEGFSRAVERDERGHVRRIVGVMKDISKHKLMEEDLRRSKDELEAQTKQLLALVSELTLVENRERRRLAEILHDDLQQLLIGAKINSEVLSARIGTDLKQLAENILDLINQSIQTSRSLTTELSPPALQQGNLSDTLEWLGRWVQEKYGLTIELQTDPDIIPASKEITILLFQSARELLLNVVKHAHVKSARLEMVRDKNLLRITVIDRGFGFDPANLWEKSHAGFGLLSIRERLSLLGGSLDVESSPGHGAVFSLVVPIKAAKEIKKTGEKNVRQSQTA